MKLISAIRKYQPDIIWPMRLRTGILIMGGLQTYRGCGVSVGT
jgi:hypothetical protein